jgi:hypothetical protein
MSKRTPAYCLHKATGQAVVRINGHDHYLGKYDSPESHAEYDRLIAEWLANGRRLPGTATAPDGISVNELALAYWKWAVAYSRWDERGGQCLKYALRVIKKLYGHTPARRFGPLALKACRQRMIETGWSRTYLHGRRMSLIGLASAKKLGYGPQESRPCWTESGLRFSILPSVFARQSHRYAGRAAAPLVGLRACHVVGFGGGEGEERLACLDRQEGQTDVAVDHELVANPQRMDLHGWTSV